MSKGKNENSQKLVDQTNNTKDNLKAKMNGLRDNATTDLDTNINELPNSLSDASLNLTSALNTVGTAGAIKFNKDINLWDNNMQ